MSRPQQHLDADRAADSAFRISVIIKGIGGAGELILGLILIFISAATLRHALIPFGAIGASLSHEISDGARMFVIFYAISRGIIRLGLAIALLQLRLWAYPAAIIFLLGTVLYQIFLLLHHFNGALTALTVFDTGIIFLTGYEYRKLRRGGHIHKGLL